MGYFGDDSAFLELFEQSTSASSLVRLLGRAVGGNNIRLVLKEVQRLCLDTSHWNIRKGTQAKLDPASIFVENSKHSTAVIKRVVLRHGLLQESCALCGMGTEWNGKPLVLRLDHENGVHTDHRLKNLRFLCPNCDSQTETYCGGNRRNPIRHCTCGRVIHRNSRHCLSCAAKERYKKQGQPTKAAWPSYEDLKTQVAASSCAAIARGLHVSETAVRKRLAQGARHELATTCTCGQRKGTHSRVCRQCSIKSLQEFSRNRHQVTKISWPSMDVLKASVRASSYQAVARELGVSDNAVRKHLRSSMIEQGILTSQVGGSTPPEGSK